MFADRTDWNLTPNRLSEALSHHRAAGKPLIDLTASNPTACGFLYGQEAILHALSNPEVLSYEPSARGLESARRAVVSYYAARNTQISPEDILLTISTSEAYSFIFRTLCDSGDELLIPEPSYPLFGFLADIQDVRLVRYPLLYDHGWQIDFHTLEQAITPRSRGVIVVHPNNPTGHFTKPAEFVQLNKFCASRQMALIADEVFLDFTLGENPPLSFAANCSALTFTVSGISKISGLPQMKAAWLITSGPEPLKQQAFARLELIADTYLSMNAPVQLALPAFLEQRHTFQRQVLTRIRKNIAELDRLLAQQSHCTRLHLEGGWYAVLRVPATRSDEDFAIDLLTTKDVYVHPGHFYDSPSDGLLIVSLITREHEFAEGILRLLSLF